ncbi:hypothetical protein PUN28_001977 [Cardiocondyla obscurior]|uniref:Uncharacterized protein n=1 Tax=Cardiocondyla obscurior TaxID=286306 RepID=A0AAW2GS06_9HYME
MGNVRRENEREFTLNIERGLNSKISLRARERQGESKVGTRKGNESKKRKKKKKREERARNYRSRSTLKYIEKITDVQFLLEKRRFSFRDVIELFDALILFLSNSINKDFIK